VTIAERVAFWGQLHRRLAALSNRIGADDQAKIIGSIHARIPMVTIDEQRRLQRENAEADERFWAGLQEMSAGAAEGQRELAANASRKAAESEASAKDAADKAATAKERLARLAKGEDVSGGLHRPTPRKDLDRILMDAGWSADDIRFSAELAGLRGDTEFDAYVKQICELEGRAEKSTRWKVLRQIRAERDAAR
jgi:hypothetical protein